MSGQVYFLNFALDQVLPYFSVSSSGMIFLYQRNYENTVETYLETALSFVRITFVFSVGCCKQLSVIK